MDKCGVMSDVRAETPSPNSPPAEASDETSCLGAKRASGRRSGLRERVQRPKGLEPKQKKHLAK